MSANSLPVADEFSLGGKRGKIRSRKLCRQAEFHRDSFHRNGRHFWGCRPCTNPARFACEGNLHCILIFWRHFSARPHRPLAAEVCNLAGTPWLELPAKTSDQRQSARRHQQLKPVFMTNHPAADTPAPRPVAKLDMETAAALAGTLFVALLMVLTAMYAGPLWRDEVNTINVAQMPSLTALWQSMPFESFPPLWPLLLRGFGLLGLIGSDASIRVAGLFVGLLFLASLWLGIRCLGGRAPILSIALLGCLPAFLFTVSSNRAYGLASCLLVFSFGTIWRLVEQLSWKRALTAGLTCLLFAHCVYYDVLFLAAMLAGGALVALRERKWRTLVALTLIGAVSAGSMIIYLPVIHRGTAYVPMMQWPFFQFSTLWNKLREAVTARSSAELGPNGPEIWIWLGLIGCGLAAALWSQRKIAQPQATTASPAGRRHANLAIFCIVAMILGVVFNFVFLFRLHYVTQKWYYVEMLCLCAIALDGLLGVSRPALRPWGWLRIGFMVLMMAWGAKPVWTEAHTRRSNVDLVAVMLEKTASKSDLIVVVSAFEGISFNQYYHGQTHWVTTPPVNSHQICRNDLIFEKMNAQLNDQEPMRPVLNEMARTLLAGNNVWIVGNMGYQRPKPSPKSGLPAEWSGTHIEYWNGQVWECLKSHARRAQVFETPTGGPVSCLEDEPLIQFSGYRSETDPVVQHQ